MKKTANTVSISRRERGFTLGELMTALAVAGLSVSLAVPAMTTLVNNNRRITAVNQMVTTMHAARSEAITRNGWVMVCPSKDGTGCNGSTWDSGWIYFSDTDRDRTLDADENIIGTSPAAPKMAISSSEFPGYFLYRANGRIMGTASSTNQGQFTFCDPRGADHARVIVVSMSGQPTLSETQANGSAPSC